MKNTKKTRRVAAFAAAVMMAACVAVPMSSFSASAEGTGSITITDGSGATKSSLAAFQIFTAQVTGDSFVVNGWGSGIDVTALNAKIQSSTLLANDFTGVTIADGAASAQKVADVVAGFTGANSAKATEFARIAAQCKKGDGTAAEGNTISGLDTGYYIVVDTTAASNGNYESFTLGMLTVVTGADTPATVKRNFPTFDKQIGDINDSTDTAETYTYNEAADHDMGDAVPFKLKATVPSNIDQYDTYKMIFHDDLQANVFAFNDDSVKVNYYSSSTATAIDVTNSFALGTTPTSNTTHFPSDSHTDGTEDFTLTCNDIKGISAITGGVAAGGYFEVEYTATLTTSANMGATGNWNGAYLEYSNNPNVSGSGDTNNTGDSPTDYVVAFTYQTVVEKQDGITNAPLAGATFKLEKKLNDGTTKEISVVTADSGTTFVFNGLDDGNYVLTETAPTGYNPVAPIEFTINASETQTDGSEALASLSASSTGTAAFATGKVYVINDNKSSDSGADNGSVKTTVLNYKGASLPSTGGIGTTLFYVGGGVLVAGAGVLLITKKRAKKDAE